MIQSEIWKDIPGYEGLYQASTEGEIRNKKRLTILSQHIVGKYMKYLQVTLYKNNVKKQLYVHRLVLMTFTPNPDNLPEVNHKDENTFNNKLSNLEWCDRFYNASYGTKKERVSKALTNGKTSKPVIQMTRGGSVIKEWPSQGEIRRVLGYSQQNISACCRGKLRQAYGFIWKYKKTEAD